MKIPRFENFYRPLSDTFLVFPSHFPLDLAVLLARWERFVYVGTRITAPDFGCAGFTQQLQKTNTGDGYALRYKAMEDRTQWVSQDGRSPDFLWVAGMAVGEMVLCLYKNGNFSLLRAGSSRYCRACRHYQCCYRHPCRRSLMPRFHRPREG